MVNNHRKNSREFKSSSHSPPERGGSLLDWDKICEQYNKQNAIKKLNYFARLSENLWKKRKNFLKLSIDRLLWTWYCIIVQNNRQLKQGCLQVFVGILAFLFS
mgnify:CR=1 FL=1